MKYILMLLLAAFVVNAEDVKLAKVDAKKQEAANAGKAGPVSPYKAGDLTIEPFYAAMTTDFDDFKEGIGIGATAWLWNNIGLGANFISYLPENRWYGSIHDANIDEVNVNLYLRYPIGVTPFAVYGFSGAGNSFIEDEWHFNLGGGLSARITKFQAFADVGLVQDRDDSAALIRGGIGYNF